MVAPTYRFVNRGRKNIFEYFAARFCGVHRYPAYGTFLRTRAHTRRAHLGTCLLLRIITLIKADLRFVVRNLRTLRMFVLFEIAEKYFE